MKIVSGPESRKEVTKCKHRIRPIRGFSVRELIQGEKPGRKGKVTKESAVCVKKKSSRIKSEHK